jgi:hypothetical protein
MRVFKFIVSCLLDLVAAGRRGTQRIRMKRIYADQNKRIKRIADFQEKEDLRR